LKRAPASTNAAPTPIIKFLKYLKPLVLTKLIVFKLFSSLEKMLQIDVYTDFLSGAKVVIAIEQTRIKNGL